MLWKEMLRVAAYFVTGLVYFLQAIVEEDCMPVEQFSQHLLPNLLSLSSDPVANVRVLVAKALRQSVMEKGKKANFFFPE